MHESNKEKTAQNIVALAEELGDDVPSMDDFFGDQKNKDSDNNAG